MLGGPHHFPASFFLFSVQLKVCLRHIVFDVVFVIVGVVVTRGWFVCACPWFAFVLCGLHSSCRRPPKATFLSQLRARAAIMRVCAAHLQ